MGAHEGMVRSGVTVSAFSPVQVVDVAACITFGEEPKHGKHEYEHHDTAMCTLGGEGVGVIMVMGGVGRFIDTVGSYPRPDEVHVFARFRYVCVRVPCNGRGGSAGFTGRVASCVHIKCTEGLP